MNERGVARGVSGRDKGDESLRNEEALACVLSASPVDDTASVIRVGFIGFSTLTFGRRGSSPGRGNCRVPGVEGFHSSGFNPLALHRKRVWDKGVRDGTVCWRCQ